jgi:hypothetical protein
VYINHRGRRGSQRIILPLRTCGVLCCLFWHFSCNFTFPT